MRHSGAWILPLSAAGMRTTMTHPARALACAALLAIAPPALSAQNPCAATDSVVADSMVAIPVVIIARVHADAVVFESDPDVRVTLNGCDPLPGQVVTSSTLPDTIEPGVRYTNVEVSTEYRVWLTMECRAPDGVAARLCEELTRRD